MTEEVGTSNMTRLHRHHLRIEGPIMFLALHLALLHLLLDMGCHHDHHFLFLLQRQPQRNRQYARLLRK